METLNSECLGKVATHAKHVGVPGWEPAGEGGGLTPLFDQDDGGADVTPRGVVTQVVLRLNERLLLLRLIGSLADPQENLETRAANHSGHTLFTDTIACGKYLPLTDVVEVSPGPRCPAA